MSVLSDTIVVLDFGGQYAHLIANRVRRLGAYTEILHGETSAAAMLKENSNECKYRGIILSGGPHSVKDVDAPKFDPKVLELGVPVLGLCYGHQSIAVATGGVVARGNSCEYGLAKMTVVKHNAAPSPLFHGLSDAEQIWMSHGDAVTSIGDGFAVIGKTPECEIAAVANEERRIYGLQFHPEVTDTPNGMKILGNFIQMCGCQGSWNPEAFLHNIRSDIKKKCEGKKVFLLVSGGVDSTVAFALLNDTLGADRVRGLHVDTGMMREGESRQIIEFMRASGFDNLDVVDASDKFLRALERVAEPERKRIIIGQQFIEVKVEEERRMGLNAEEWLLGQGTIYPDTIESAGTKHADKIKTHHNRVDVLLELIERGLVIEPLASLYKDEVRMIGEALGLPKSLVWRHPFPGPGLGVRLLCSNGVEKNVAVNWRDDVVAACSCAGYKLDVLPVQSVGVQGDGRTYAHPALLTPVASSQVWQSGNERNISFLDKIDWAALEALSTFITNATPGINRVVLSLTEQDQSQKQSPNASDYKLIEGYVTKDRLDRLRAVDHIVATAISDSGEYAEVWQMCVVLLPLVSSSTSGGECVVLRPVKSQEAMTARFCPLRTATLERILRSVEGSVGGIGDVFFDVTNKPPGTIEWE